MRRHNIGRVLIYRIGKEVLFRVRIGDRYFWSDSPQWVREALSK